MGYDLHITRKKDWADEEGPTISLEEFLALVKEDPELQLEPGNESGSDGHGAAWKSGQSQSVFWWANDEISAKNPDEAVIEKMLQMAGKLNAKVVGDDGEVYPLEKKPNPRNFAKELVIYLGVMLAIGVGLLAVIWGLTGSSCALTHP